MYVYILTSLRTPDNYYVGMTADLRRRLSEHNDGKSRYTQALRPWKMTAAFWFADKQKAALFERSLKSSSGRAFSAKHF
jgi:putative endonuclease